MHINIFFNNRICDIWNALPNFVFDVSSSNSFRRLFDNVDLSQFTVLLWLFIVIILLGICKWLHALYVEWLCSISMFTVIKRCLLDWLIDRRLHDGSETADWSAAQQITSISLLQHAAAGCRRRHTPGTSSAWWHESSEKMIVQQQSPWLVESSRVTTPIERWLVRDQRNYERQQGSFLNPPKNSIWISLAIFAELTCVHQTQT